MLCFIVFGCQYQCNWLHGETRLRNDLLCVEWDVKPYTLTHSLWSVLPATFATTPGVVTRACERSGSGRISAHRSNPFLWLPIPAPFPAPRPPATVPANFLHPLTAPLRLTRFSTRSAPPPLLLQYVSSSNLEKWTNFYRASICMLARDLLS